MVINDNSSLLWLLVGGMLLIAWLVMPLGSFYRYVQDQHCLQTIGRRSTISSVTIQTVEATPILRARSSYKIALIATDGSFRFAYEGTDDFQSETNYHIAELYRLLVPLEEKSEPIKVRWVHSRFWAGDAPLITHINEMRVPANCAWGWIPVYVLMFAFFTMLTAMVISAVATTQHIMEQDGKVSQNEIINVVVDRWVRWLEERFGKKP